jgi:hypothetical protein
MSEQRPWHRLFWLSWMDFFRGQPVQVESEKDLSTQRQLLDLILLHTTPGVPLRGLPDGFDDLGTHNLITFESFQEALEGWTLDELVGHYVNYRKQISSSMRELLPAADFRRFAVCVRFPHNLAQEV